MSTIKISIPATYDSECLYEPETELIFITDPTDEKDSIDVHIKDTASTRRLKFDKGTMVAILKSMLL